MQGSKSSSVYFVKYGRVKILRNVDFVESSEAPTIHNYQNLYREPTSEDQALGRVNQRQLEIV